MIVVTFLSAWILFAEPSAEGPAVAATTSAHLVLAVPASAPVLWRGDEALADGESEEDGPGESTFSAETPQALKVDSDRLHLTAFLAPPGPRHRLGSVLRC